MSGKVYHVWNGVINQPDVYGQFKRCLLLDGVMLVIDVDSLKKNKESIIFDESNPYGFHFYDLDFCLTCNSYGIKMGTFDTKIAHNSHGLTNPNDPNFLKSHEWFKNNLSNGKYSKRV